MNFDNLKFQMEQVVKELPLVIIETKKIDEEWQQIKIQQDKLTKKNNDLGEKELVLTKKKEQVQQMVNDNNENKELNQKTLSKLEIFRKELLERENSLNERERAIKDLEQRKKYLDKREVQINQKEDDIKDQQQIIDIDRKILEDKSKILDLKEKKLSTEKEKLKRLREIE